MLVFPLHRGFCVPALFTLSIKVTENGWGFHELFISQTINYADVLSVLVKTEERTERGREKIMSHISFNPGLAQATPALECRT